MFLLYKEDGLLILSNINCGIEPNKKEQSVQKCGSKCTSRGDIYIKKQKGEKATSKFRERKSTGSEAEWMEMYDNFTLSEASILRFKVHCSIIHSIKEQLVQHSKILRQKLSILLHKFKGNDQMKIEDNFRHFPPFLCPPDFMWIPSHMQLIPQILNILDIPSENFAYFNHFPLLHYNLNFFYPCLSSPIYHIVCVKTFQGIEPSNLEWRIEYQ